MHLNAVTPGRGTFHRAEDRSITGSRHPRYVMLSPGGSPVGGRMAAGPAGLHLPCLVDGTPIQQQLLCQGGLTAQGMAVRKARLDAILMQHSASCCAPASSS